MSIVLDDQPDMTDEQKRVGKVVVFVLYTLEQLKRKGFIEGPEVLTGKGYEEGEQLTKEGFMPTEEEMHVALGWIQSGGLNEKSDS